VSLLFFCYETNFIFTAESVSFSKKTTSQDNKKIGFKEKLLSWEKKKLMMDHIKQG